MKKVLVLPSLYSGFGTEDREVLFVSKKEKKHRLLKAVGITAAAGCAAYGGLSYYIFREAFDTEGSSFYAKIPWDRPPNQERNDEWFASSVRDEDYIESYDGLKLHAIRITNHPEHHKWVMVIHGYHSSASAMMDWLYRFDQMGYNVFAPDMRASGLSQGRYTGFGWPEHYDVISWINYLIRLDPEAEIALFGASAGAAAVMYTTGDYLPANVKCAVEDCGFSDLREIIVNQVSEMANGVPSDIFMRGVDLFVAQILHYSMYDVSIRRALSQSRTPTLFIHGEADTLVPVSMVYENYYACAAEKDLLVVENAGHCAACMSEEYDAKIREFLNQHGM